ncbi:MAG TPA: RNA polymerase subunit sigma-70 [Solirubrobacter sp.]|nr:RNA polymerase subunit sigma-70 [Solirubrobacter sp.]
MTTEAEFAARAERHRRELHVHCYRMMGSFEEAEDLVQETLLRAWRNRGELEQDRYLRAWLYKIATNACLDAIKSKKRRVPSLSSFGDVPWLTPYPDVLLPAEDEPDAALFARETIELTFLAVIQLLPPRQRAVLVLRDVLDWPAKEVAELLEIGVAAVNSALQRARDTLQRHLPAGRREEWVSPEASIAERELLQRFIDSHERGDTEAALAAIADDIRVTMPPHPMVFEGREAILSLLDRAFGPDGGQWRLLPTRANRMPAAASYWLKPGDDTFRAFKLDVLHVRDGKIAEITTFGSALFETFGLPATL